jgi:hypothetical protein
VVYAGIAAAGLAAGAVELFLLRRFVQALMKGDAAKGAVLIPIKLLVLAAGLMPALVIEPSLLWLSGVCIAAPLIIGGVASGIRGFMKGGSTNG